MTRYSARHTLFTVICMLLAAYCVPLSAQSQISTKKRELERLRSSITATKKKIDALSGNESKAMRTLGSAQRQQHRVSSFIATLESELQSLQDSASTLETQIASTRNALQKTEDAYERAARSLIELRAKRRGLPPRSTTTNELFRSISAQVSAYRARMSNLRDSLASQQDLLNEYATTKNQVLTSKEQEQQRLSSTIAGSQKQIRRIQSDKRLLVQELQKKKKSAQRMRSIIGDLVARAERDRRAREAARAAERERKRREALARNSKKTPRASAKPGNQPLEDDVSTGGPITGGFGAKSLPWPTASRALVHGYGSYSNPETGTVLENPGIDIRCALGTSVLCVGAGEVSSVSWLPGFGSLVIVDHHNGFRSVYANLATVNVRSGSTVRSGTLVGTSGESVDGTFVHFELWRGRERLNPLTYLR